MGLSGGKEMTECQDCKNFNCYDDGLGYWDIWCDGLVHWKESPPEKYPKECEYYEVAE
jgi:hypothetical protein